MSEKWEEKFEELRHDIQKINNIVHVIVMDVTRNQHLTLATSHYLEEVAEVVKSLEKTLEERSLMAASEQQ